VGVKSGFPQFAELTLDLQRLIPEDLQKDDLDALAAVVKGVATNPQGYGSSPKIQADLETAVMKVAQKYPWALEVVQNPANHKDDPVARCGAIIAIYSEILAIPSSNRSGAVLRNMFSE
jgi:hypothetical protein